MQYGRREHAVVDRNAGAGVNGVRKLLPADGEASFTA